MSKRRLWIGAAVLGCAAVAAVSWQRLSVLTTAQQNDWHMHGPEKMSMVVSRVVGPGWTIDWQAGPDPVVNSDLLWNNAVRVYDPNSASLFTIANTFLQDTAAVNPAWAFAACWNREDTLTIVPQEQADAPTCKRNPGEKRA
ncbi:hypothetical protein LMG29542_02473 [Paraburkholderia humisilvae]|uniref:Uncharacterized protein n=2 Tax=Paraburkholderia humisilvae TaxID=627669 RepID=A0A6J5DPF6_9BURK|nr:hypothetical protein LMG29542_02473 [Paraburkholderia humisilvae]